MDIATLGIAVDSSQATKAASDLNRLAHAAGGAEDATKRVTAASRAAAAAQSAQARASAALTTQLRGYAAALAPLAIAGAFVKNTIEAEKAQAQLAATLKSTGYAAGLTSGELNSLATQLQSVTAYEDDAILKAEGLLLTFKRIGSDIFPQATEAILNVSTAMGTDLQSAVVQVGKALNDPILGLTALTRSGIQFTDSQKDTIKSMVAVGNVAGAQAIVLKELESQFGRSARAARNTLGGALSALQNSFGNLFEVSKDGSETLRGSIEDLIAVLDAPSTQTAVQNFGAWLFDGFADALGGLRNFATAWELFKKGYLKDAALIANGQADGLLFGNKDYAEAMLRNGMFTQPTDSWDAFYDAVRGGGSKKGSGKAGVDALAGGGGISDELTAQLQGRLDSLSQSLMTEREMQLNSYAVAMTDLADFNKAKLISDQEYTTLSAALHKQLTQQQTASALSAAGTIVDSLTTVFGESKALSIASAIINTAEGVTKALAQGGFLGFAQAAAVGAAGIAQIAAISRTNPGSTGNLPGVGSRPGAAVANDNAASSAPSQAVNVTIHGQSVSADQMRDLFDQINAYAADGGRLSRIVITKAA